MDIKIIDSFFAEGKRLWDVNPEMVISQQFYQLWEEAHQPKPFVVKRRTIRIAGQKFKLVSDDKGKVGYYVWDSEEMSPVFIVESTECREKFILGFCDGEANIIEADPEFSESCELEHGNRLEIIYDVIFNYLKRYPGKDIFRISKCEYLDILEDISSAYDAVEIRVMQRLSMLFIKKLMTQASADVALDEVSKQLSLPIGGSYAGGSALGQKRQQQNLTYSIPMRSRWEIQNELDFLHLANKLNAQNELTFRLSLSGATVMQDGDEGLIIKVMVGGGIPIHEGDVLNICTGSTTPVGRLSVDLLDNSIIYGAITWLAGYQQPNSFANFYAQPQYSSSHFIARAMNGLRRIFSKKDEPLAKGFKQLVGLSPTSLQINNQDTPPPHLDASQCRAWGCAILAENPVVLIQGPPGTGKTSVLEQVIRTLCQRKQRILITAPSNTAVDNICRRIQDLPLLRLGNRQSSIDPDIAKKFWNGIPENVKTFFNKSQQDGCTIYAGTHIGISRSKLVYEDYTCNGAFDVIIFDEAGMANVSEFLICAEFGNRSILFGDQKQLPPFPLPSVVIERLKEEYGVMSSRLDALIHKSALEWLSEQRKYPIIQMQISYRCQNPRLLRFASLIFYDALVKASEKAEYYQLSYQQRQQKYPAKTLKLITTSNLPDNIRNEQLIYQGQKPGIQNNLEAKIAIDILFLALKQYPMHEITIIAPYRKHIKLIRKLLDYEEVFPKIESYQIEKQDWEAFLHNRIATVDSFQGGESDVVIICYVRSNQNQGIGFVDDHNRINVAHTRCRKEMTVIADMQCLKREAKSDVFKRMERAFKRDGIIIEAKIKSSTPTPSTAPKDNIAEPLKKLQDKVKNAKDKKDKDNKENKYQPKLFDL